MKQLKYPQPIENLIESLRQIPGIGRKTAERYAFNILSWQKQDLFNLAKVIHDMPSKISKCSTCRCLKSDQGCQFCTSTSRDTSSLCIVASVKDVFLIEETGVFKGLYHVIDHLFSPLDGQMLSKEDLAPVLERIQKLCVKEIILAFDSTLEGDATSLYLQDLVKNFSVSTTRLALGIPMGSSLDFIDEHTLSKAFVGRVSV
ncbi:recombination protein RecR [Candidatus Aerophobetes bacterium]|uniref:Recombination protein RecR n=1 Tax=Aerophobetes bacterium TaxID=2030807 RepID=A0A2A4X674_UNCAE|nr:MAG: recombination protein RecR [Candidatus Aerophobetes bacterium]